MMSFSSSASSGSSSAPKTERYHGTNVIKLFTNKLERLYLASFSSLVKKMPSLMFVGKA
jgi:hypothetical protein